MLADKWTFDALADVLIDREDWHPFPTATERDPWESILPHIRTAHLTKGGDLLGHTWPALPATLFLDFARTGNRRNYETVSFGRRNSLRDLVIAECVQGQGRFVDDIVNGIWAICEESFWGIPACMYMQKPGPGLPDVEEPVVPLFVAETISLLAWTVYLIGPALDEVSPLVVPRIKHESQRRVLAPLLERDDFWWMGLTGEAHPITGRKRRVNNWNPWICSNWMTAALILEEDEQVRTEHIHKAIRCVDQFVDPYPTDGGCDEGPSYWGRAGASLFDCLELLHSATGGAIDAYTEPLVQEIGRFIYRAQIDGQYFTNFADASALVRPSPTISYIYGKRIGDEDMMDFGAWASRQTPAGPTVGDPKPAQWSIENLIRGLPAIFTAPEILERSPRQPLPRDVWLPEIEVLIARDQAGSADGLFLAAKGGHNEESHNHNDIGTFSVYAGGRPLLVDAGVGTYTAKTFGPDRYDIWTMQTAYHNLPTFNGVQQRDGMVYAASNVAYESDDETASLALDIHKAYEEGSGLESWRRTAKLTRGTSVVVDDVYCFASEPTDLVWHLITPSDIHLEEDGWIHLTPAQTVRDRESAEGWVHFDPTRADASSERIEIDDERMSAFWGDHLNRITLKSVSPEASGSFSVSISERR
ncbi:TPA: heparinase [Candidatus Latescibacteria bacterium]|nr:heparinase [Candidatus Latescibacterota bacterium]